MFSFRCGIGDDLGGKRIGQGKMVSSNKREKTSLSSWKSQKQ